MDGPVLFEADDRIEIHGLYAVEDVAFRAGIRLFQFVKDRFKNIRFKNGDRNLQRPGVLLYDRPLLFVRAPSA